jgi:hypothetical protein
MTATQAPPARSSHQDYVGFSPDDQMGAAQKGRTASPVVI